MSDVSGFLDIEAGRCRVLIIFHIILPSKLLLWVILPHLNQQNWFYRRQSGTVFASSSFIWNLIKGQSWQKYFDHHVETSL